jgi:hypothetical protein
VSCNPKIVIDIRSWILCHVCSDSLENKWFKIFQYRRCGLAVIPRKKLIVFSYMNDIQLFQFPILCVMASQHILSGPEMLLKIPDISLGRYLYQKLVSHGNAVAMVSTTLFRLLFEFF